jgi:hypothetical protein
LEKVEQKIWLHLSTFGKSRAKDLAQPFLKVDKKYVNPLAPPF